jgi:hypothetical protein
MAQCWRKNPIENRGVTAAQIVAYNSARLSVLKARTYQTGPRAGQILAELANWAVLEEMTKPVRR